MNNTTKTVLAVAAGAAAGLLAGWLLLPKRDANKDQKANANSKEKEDDWSDNWNKSTERAYGKSNKVA